MKFKVILVLLVLFLISPGFAVHGNDPNTPYGTSYGFAYEPTLLGIHWKDYSYGESGWEIQKSLDDINWENSGTVTSTSQDSHDASIRYKFNDTGLNPDTKYHHRVRTLYPDGSASSWDPVYYNSYDTYYMWTPPAAPSSSSFSGVTTDSITLNFNRNGNPSYTEYEIWKCTSNWFEVGSWSDCTQDTINSDTTRTFTSLDVNKKYYFMGSGETSWDHGWDSPLIDLGNIATLDEPIYDLWAWDRWTSGIRWSWNHHEAEMENREFKMELYNGDISIDSDITSYLSWQTPSPDDAYSLLTNTEYKIKVWSVNKDGALSTVTENTAYTHIERPSGVSFSNIGTTSMDVSITGTFSNLGAGSSGVKVYGSGYDSGWQTSTSDAKIYARDLISNQEYCFRARSKNGDGVKTDPTTSQCRYTNPASPTSQGITDIEVNSMVVNWGHGTNAQDTEYQVEVCRSVICEKTGWMSAINYTVTTHNGGELLPDREYSFKVRSRSKKDHSITSGWTNLGSEYTLSAPPTNFSILPDSYTVAPDPTDISADPNDYIPDIDPNDIKLPTLPNPNDYIDSINVTVPKDFVDGFEDQNLNPFVTNGDSNWIISTEPHSGDFSAKSGSISINQESNLILKESMDTPGRISFYYKIEGIGKFKFFINGENALGQGASLSNFEVDNGWSYISFPIETEGSHEFTWKFEDGTGYVLIDDINLGIGTNAMVPNPNVNTTLPNPNDYTPNSIGVTFSDDFDDATMSPFTTGGEVNWSISGPYDVDSYYFGDYGNYTEIVIDTGSKTYGDLILNHAMEDDGIISFFYLLSINGDIDSKLEFLVDGEVFFSLETPNMLWNEISVPVPKGNHEFRWRYSGRYSEVRLDNVTITEGVPYTGSNVDINIPDIPDTGLTRTSSVYGFEDGQFPTDFIKSEYVDSHEWHVTNKDSFSGDYSIRSPSYSYWWDGYQGIERYDNYLQLNRYINVAGTIRFSYKMTKLGIYDKYSEDLIETELENAFSFSVNGKEIDLPVSGGWNSIEVSVEPGKNTFVWNFTNQHYSQSGGYDPLDIVVYIDDVVITEEKPIHDTGIYDGKVYDFEDGESSFNDFYIWGPPWSIDSSTSTSGISSARSGSVCSFGEKSILDLHRSDLGDDMAITFDVKVEHPSYLKFLVDGVLVWQSDYISNWDDPDNSKWMTISVPIQKNPLLNDIDFRWIGESSMHCGDGNSNTVWIDNIRFEPVSPGGYKILEE